MDAILVVRNAYRAKMLQPFVGVGVLVVGYGDSLCSTRADTIVLVDSLEEALYGSEHRREMLTQWVECDLLTCLKPGGRVLP